jgi:hypothetical protein
VYRWCHRFAPEWRRAPEWSGQESGAVLRVRCSRFLRAYGESSFQISELMMYYLFIQILGSSGKESHSDAG